MTLALRFLAEVVVIGFDSEFLVVPLFLALVIYFFIRIFLLKNKSKSFVIIDLAFILYCFLVINSLYFPLEIYYNSNCVELKDIHFNLMPFVNTYKSLVATANSGLSLTSLIYIIGNLFVFVPLSLFLLLRFPERKYLNTLIIISISLFAEIFQLILIFITKDSHRIIDIDDLLLNFIGATTSWLILNKLFK